MASLDELLQEIRPNVPGAPILSIRRAIRNAAKKFCEQSLAWQYDLESFTLTANTRTQDLSSSLPADSVIHEVNSVSRSSDGSPISRSSRQELTASDPRWRTKTAAKPAYFFRSSPTELEFAYQPEAAFDVDMTLVLTVSRDATTIDDDLLEDYWQTISAGAMASLTAMPGQEWSDPAMAQVHAASFAQGILDAKRKALQDNTPKSHTMQYHDI